MQLGRLRGWVGAEFLGQPLTEALVGRQRRSWRARQLLGQHQRPVGVLVEWVVGHGGQSQFDSAMELAERQRSAPGAPPGATQQPLTVPPGVVDPGGRRLVGEDLAAAKQIQHAIGGDRGKRRVAGGKVSLRPGQELGSLVQVHSAARVAGPAVSTTAGGDAVATDDPTQPAYQRGDVLLRLAGRRGAPQGLHDRVDGHVAAASHQ